MVKIPLPRASAIKSLAKTAARSKDPMPAWAVPPSAKTAAMSCEPMASALLPRLPKKSSTVAKSPFPPVATA
ncbi:hypothetical protein [Mycobacterium sp.]|uniref:hypothetical protein n=1 Tax=Mycobacterium sp. TaxID=1785 RepID=UPI003C70ACAA